MRDGSDYERNRRERRHSSRDSIEDRRRDRKVEPTYSARLFSDDAGADGGGDLAMMISDEQLLADMGLAGGDDNNNDGENSDGGGYVRQGADAAASVDGDAAVAEEKEGDDAFDRANYAARIQDGERYDDTSDGDGAGDDGHHHQQGEEEEDHQQPPPSPSFPSGTDIFEGPAQPFAADSQSGDRDTRVQDPASRQDSTRGRISRGAPVDDATSDAAGSLRIATHPASVAHVTASQDASLLLAALLAQQQQQQQQQQPSLPPSSLPQSRSAAAAAAAAGSLNITSASAPLAFPPAAPATASSASLPPPSDGYVLVLLSSLRESAEALAECEAELAEARRQR